MDQKKIGAFLKELRREKGLTQEQFAEKLNVSGRTVSRWETGSNMPDISLLLLIADFFGVSIPEIIGGERKCDTMEKETKEVVEKLSDYAEAEKALLLKRARVISIIGLISLLVGLTMEMLSPDSENPIYEVIKGSCLGMSVGALITMVLYTTGTLAKIKEKRSKQMQRVAVAVALIWGVILIAALLISFLRH